MTSQTQSQECYIEMLQPLRDLALNWDVDIASCLEEYLNDILLHNTTTSQTQSEHDSAATLTASSVGEGVGIDTNFTSAALLLQNAGSVYGRKVEFLYREVYKALDTILTSTSSNISNSNNSKGMRKTGEVYDEYGMFGLLDEYCVLSEDNEECDLVVLDQDENNDISDHYDHPDTLLHHSSNSSNTAQVQARVNIQPVLPQTYLPTDGTLLSSGALLPSIDGVLLLPDEGEQSRNIHIASVANVNANADTMSVAEYDYENDDDDGYLMNPTDEENYTSSNNQTGQGAADGGVTSHTNDGAIMKSKNTWKNPWSTVDPHISTHKARPLKVGKCYLDASSSSSTKRKRQGTSTSNRNNCSELLYTVRYDVTLGYYRGTLLCDYLDTGLVVGHCMPEFDYVAKCTARRMRQLRKEQQRSSRSTPVVGYDTYQNNDYDDDDNDYYDDDDDDNVYNPNDINTASLVVPSALQDDHDNDDDLYHSSSNALYPNVGTNSHRHNSNSKVLYSTSTLLHRVDAWQNKLAPILEEEEHRPVFDVHQYGTDLLQHTSSHSSISRKSMQKGNSTVTSFQVLCDTAEIYDVPRYFLATLMLANAGCVRLEQQKHSTSSISTQKKASEECGMLYVEVLSSEYHYGTAANLVDQ